MKELKNARLSETLPESILRDEKIKALAAGIDAELERLTAATREVMHLPRLDELTGRILDLLAWQFHVDFYTPLTLSDEIKRNIIRESIAWHRRKGTVSAVEDVNAMFSRKIKVQEWYEYGGEPYWFRVTTAPFKSEEELAEWTRRIYDAKNVRSWVQILFARTIEFPLYFGTAEYKHGRKRIGLMGRATVKPELTTIKDGARTLEITDKIVTIRYGSDKEIILLVLEYPAYIGQWTRRGGVKQLKPMGNATISPSLTTLQDDARTMEISPARVVIRYGEQEEIIPLVSNVDSLELKMNSATKQRVITIANPRPDITAQEIQEVTDYAIEHEIFLDNEGQLIDSSNRAVIITVEEEILF